MHKLLRRIEKLEGVRSQARRDRRKIADNALNWLRLEALEGLIGAFGAERQGRELSAGESAAKLAYQKVLTMECGRAGYASSAGFDGEFDIHDAITRAFAFRMDSQTLELSLEACMAGLQGLTPTPEQSDALQAHEAEISRLKRLAGLQAPAGDDTLKDDPR
jgi:hypothetical protein